MNHEALVAQLCNATSSNKTHKIQTLWSGYGEIARYQLFGGERDQQTVIVKSISPPTEHHHPRGWNTNTSHERKMRSYEVEKHWYQYWAKRVPENIAIAECLGIYQDPEQNLTLIALTDLDAQGFNVRHNHLTFEACKACLSWLAGFHAAFLQEMPEENWAKDLWQTGTYWHLATRQDEWKKMQDSPLKAAAQKIDTQLSECRFKTLVHGDAKVANFCFSANGKNVAAVDFQYTGAGCGIKDVAYFLGSCLTENECQRHHKTLLDFYLAKLLSRTKERLPDVSLNALEEAWRHLYPLAWADFQRFLLGWSPQHAKNNAFSQSMAEEALAAL